VKFKIDCKSPLLQYSLTYFLKDYLSEDGILITDDINKKDAIIIGKDITKPFSKKSLILELENLNTISNNFTNSSIEEKIELLCEKFKKELIEIIKEHNAKK
jgi:hypothetical protein